MSKRKQEEGKKGLDEWMGTYGDMVTLLLCFFVLLYAMSTVDVSKFQAVAASFSKMTISIVQSGGSDGIMEMLGNGIIQMPVVKTQSIIDNKKSQQESQKEMKQMSSDFKTYFAENNLQDHIEMKVTEDSITLNFKDGILFDVGKANIRQEALSILDMVATELLKFPENAIVIEGHTDSDPISTPLFPSNWHLSSYRAINVGIFFQNDKGIDPSRISTSGMGEFRPVAPNDTPENKAKNRRVEIKIMSKYYNE